MGEQSESTPRGSITIMRSNDDRTRDTSGGSVTASIRSSETTKPDSSSTERRDGRGRSSSRGGRKQQSDIEEKPDEEANSKEDIPFITRSRSTSRGGRRRVTARDLGTADPSSGENSTGYGRRSSSRGTRSRITVKGGPGSTDESSSSDLPQRRSNSFDEDLFSSKDLSASLPPQEIVPDGLLVASTKIESSKVNLDDSSSLATTDLTTEKNHSTKPDSSSTERRGCRGRSSSRGRRKQPSDMKEKPGEETNSKEDVPFITRARSTSREGRRRDTPRDLGTVDQRSGEISTEQRQRSNSRGRRRMPSKDPGIRHSTEENTKQNPVRARSNSRGRRRACLASMEDSVLSADPTQTSRLLSTSQSSVNRNAANSLSSSKSLSGQSSKEGSKNMLLQRSLHGNLEAKSWGSLQESFSSLGASEHGRGGGSRSGRPSRRMPKGTVDQDRSMDSSLHEATKGLGEAKIQASCELPSVDLRERFKSDFPEAKDMPTDDELNELYINAQDTASETTPSQAASTETETSEPQKDSEDEEDEEALETTTEKPKISYSDKLMAATKGKPASSTMSIKAVRTPQALSGNTLDSFKKEPKEAEVAQAMPELSAPRRGPGLKKLVKSVSAKFSSKNSAIDSDDGSVHSGEDKKEVRKAMKKYKQDDAQPGGDDSLVPTTVRKPQALSGNTLDPFKKGPKEAEIAQAMPELGAPRRGPGLTKLVKSVSAKFSSKNSAILDNSDDGSVNSSEDKKEVRKAMKKYKTDDAQPGGDDSSLGVPRRGPGLTKLVKSVSAKFSSKNSAIDDSDDGSVNSSAEDKKEVRKVMKKYKKDDAQPGGDDSSLGVPRRGPGLTKLVKSVSAKFSSKNSSIDDSDDGSISSSEDKNEVRKAMKKYKKDDAQPGGDDSSLGAPRRGPGLKQLVKSVSAKFSSKNSAIDNSDDGSISSSEDKKEVRRMVKKDKTDDASPGGDGPDEEALYKMTSILNLDQVLWNEPSGGLKGKKDKHDSSRSPSDSLPRYGRDKEDETKKQHNMSGDINITTRADRYLIDAKASKKSKGKVGSQQPAGRRKLKFISRSVANDTPNSDSDSCENMRQILRT
jgi:hypothetical protein